MTSTLAQTTQRSLLVVTATLEEAGRWTAQLEMMGWATVYFYPTAESSPYDPFDSEMEMVWGQMQVLAELWEHCRHVVLFASVQPFAFSRSGAIADTVAPLHRLRCPLPVLWAQAFHW